MAEINEKVEKILINTDNNSLIFEPSESGDATFELISLWDNAPTDGGRGSGSVTWDAIVPEGVRQIKDNIMNPSTARTCRYLTSLRLPASLISIGGSSFTGQTLMQSITAAEGSGITLGTYAFKDCVGLSSLDATFLNRITDVGNSSFAGCTSLASFKIDENLASMAAYAFDGCTGLTSVTCSETETATDFKTTGQYAFRNCSSLVSVELPARTSALDATTFSGCTNLATITIHKAPDSISGAPWGATNATVVWDGE